VLEVILRARRWARAHQRDSERVVLRGTLADMPLPSLLQVFEQEKKTGQLGLTSEELVAFIDFVDGKIVHVRSSEVEGDSRSVLMKILDWRQGFFELSAGAPPAGKTDLDATVTQLLMEHAQSRDEAER